MMREAIVALGRLRLTGKHRDERAHNLLQYIAGDRFRTRFNTVASIVDELREQQKKERTWHEHTWETESALHDRIDGSHREINAQLRGILESEATTPLYDRRRRRRDTGGDERLRLVASRLQRPEPA